MVTEGLFEQVIWKPRPEEKEWAMQRFRVELWAEEILSKYHDFRVETELTFPGQGGRGAGSGEKWEKVGSKT